MRLKTSFLVGLQEHLEIVQRRKLAWLGHVVRYDSLCKPSFRAPWMVGDTVVGGGKAGWKTSKSGHPVHARLAHNSLLQIILEEDLC